MALQGFRQEILQLNKSDCHQLPENLDLAKMTKIQSAPDSRILTKNQLKQFLKQLLGVINNQTSKNLHLQQNCGP